MSRTYRALTTLALSLALVATTAAVAVAAEDLNSQRKALYQSELAHNLETGTAARTQAAIEQARASEREFGATAAQPVVTIAPQPVPAAPGRDVGVVVIALLGLIGGAAVVAWTAASRRRHRVVAA
jgi:hypothetical protein